MCLLFYAILNNYSHSRPHTSSPSLGCGHLYTICMRGGTIFKTHYRRLWMGLIYCVKILIVNAIVNAEINFNYIYYEVIVSFLCSLGEIWGKRESHLQRLSRLRWNETRCKWLKRTHSTGLQDHEAILLSKSRARRQAETSTNIATYIFPNLKFPMYPCFHAKYCISE